MDDLVESLWPEVNWKKSFLSAETLRKLNEVPIRAKRLLGIIPPVEEQEPEPEQRGMECTECGKPSGWLSMCSDCLAATRL
jgi:hypothetical protein